MAIINEIRITNISKEKEKNARSKNRKLYLDSFFPLLFRLTKKGNIKLKIKLDTSKRKNATWRWRQFCGPLPLTAAILCESKETVSICFVNQKTQSCSEMYTSVNQIQISGYFCMFFIRLKKLTRVNLFDQIMNLSKKCQFIHVDFKAITSTEKQILK